MKTSRLFDKLLVGAGLFALGAGFVSLGFLSIFSRRPGDAENSLLGNAAYPMVGGLISVLLGGLFLVLAALFMVKLLPKKSVNSALGQRRRLVHRLISERYASLL